jgi:hypothetical protein
LFTSALYLLYAKLEEEHGMARHAMAIYERATKAVLPEEMFEVRGISQSLLFLYDKFIHLGNGHRKVYSTVGSYKKRINKLITTTLPPRAILRHSWADKIVCFS